MPESLIAEYEKEAAEFARLRVVYDNERAEHALAREAYYDRQIAEHALARDQYMAEATHVREVRKPDGRARCDCDRADVQRQGGSRALMAAQTADVVSQISALLQGHTAGIAKRVADLEGKVASESRRAADAEKLVDSLASSHETLRESLRVERETTAALKFQFDGVHSDKVALVAERQALAATMEQQTAENKGLVDTIAEQREALSTKQLEVQDLQKEAAALREQLDLVYAKIACLLPATSRTPSPFAKAVEQAVKGLEEFADTVEAVAVATGQEVTQAVRSTRNYARAAPAAGSAAAAAAAAAASASAAAAAPSPFVQMVGMVAIDRSLNTLEGEVAADAAAAAAAAAPAAHRKVFRLVREMGFDSATQETVSQLLDTHKQDVTLVIQELLSA